MALWVCQGCTAVYSVGAPACPQCGSTDYLEDGVAHVNAEGNATHYLPDGAEVPDDLPDGVQLVGPGAPDAYDAELASAEAEDADDDVPEAPPVSAPKADWVDHAEAVGLPRDEAESLTKAELVEQVRDPFPAKHAATPGQGSTPPQNSGESSDPGEDDGE